MVNSLFIFGNGLGRAISNDYFSLERALKEAWDAPKLLTDAEKRLIESCLPSDVIERENKG